MKLLLYLILELASQISRKTLQAAGYQQMRRSVWMAKLLYSAKIILLEQQFLAISDHYDQTTD